MSKEVAKILFQIVENDKSTAFPPRHFDLSKREREVLCHLVEGKKQHEIAKELFIAETTVNDHLKAIYRILEVNSQVKAVRVALQYRLCEVVK